MNQNSSINTLQDIRDMMERSSRFISLSGWSGISAGICALIGGGWAYRVMHPSANDLGTGDQYGMDAIDGISDLGDLIFSRLFLIAVLTLAAALCCALFFTWRNGRKKGQQMVDGIEQKTGDQYGRSPVGRWHLYVISVFPGIIRVSGTFIADLLWPGHHQCFKIYPRRYYMAGLYNVAHRLAQFVIYWLWIVFLDFRIWYFAHSVWNHYVVQI
ncbi:MAG: hypothetical protein KL787_06615 [Taibaiella sp.]|nr:hypothetical protein [Taibaiella sp.]